MDIEDSHHADASESKNTCKLNLSTSLSPLTGSAGELGVDSHRSMTPLATALDIEESKNLYQLREIYLVAANKALPSPQRLHALNTLSRYVFGSDLYGNVHELSIHHIAGMAFYGALNLRIEGGHENVLWYLITNNLSTMLGDAVLYAIMKDNPILLAAMLDCIKAAKAELLRKWQYHEQTHNSEGGKVPIEPPREHFAAFDSAQYKLETAMAEVPATTSREIEAMASPPTVLPTTPPGLDIGCTTFVLRPAVFHGTKAKAPETEDHASGKMTGDSMEGLELAVPS